MRRTFVLLVVFWIVICLFHPSAIMCREVVSPVSNEAQTPSLTAGVVAFAYSAHTVGQINLGITNFGKWGYVNRSDNDYFTEKPLRLGSEYPKDSNIRQLRAAGYWVGGILGSDTLVSMGSFSTMVEFQPTEFQPTDISGAAMVKLSQDTPSSALTGEAVSNEDLIARFNDTVVDPTTVDYLRRTPHIPLNIEITQKTYAWGHSNVDDFVLFDVAVKNIGTEPIKDLYFGVMSFPQVMLDMANEDGEYFDIIRGSITGFVDKAPSRLGCGIVDTLKMMWGADFNGRPVNGEFIDEVQLDEDWGWWTKSATSAHGIFFLDYPEENESHPAGLSYNWYLTCYADDLIDFGPRHRGDYRDFRTGGTGVPRGDANAYHVLSNGEIDYDFLYTPMVSQVDPIWIQPPSDVADLLSFRVESASPEWWDYWGPVNNVLSVGPYDIAPGLSVNIPFVFVCAENFHTDPTNLSNLPYSVDLFYDNLNFSPLFENASWARWVYDNPGYDTDGDDYAGEFVVCNGDTVYYTGDGIPDWRAAMPPPSPRVWLEPTLHGIRAHFNGTRSETEIDAFLEVADFEGYRVYCGRDDRAASFALITSYDTRDYNKYVLTEVGTDYEYRLYDIPYSLDSLRCLYGTGPDPCLDSTFDPLAFSTATPYTHPDFGDSIFYFRPNDYNASSLGGPRQITKTYPDEPDPSVYHPDSIPEEAYTSDGLLKYYEYEYEIVDLLPTIPHWIKVTAFDFGDPKIGLAGLESVPIGGIPSVLPLSASDAAAGGNSQVYVYPNPYRIDADYREQGFEGRTEEDRPDYRVRALNFGNLPAKCTICIYSLDGDLIRSLNHDFDPADPNSSHDSWNLITRNTQMVVSGLYYWVVEAEDGSTQMGKFVVIM